MKQKVTLVTILQSIANKHQKIKHNHEVFIAENVQTSRISLVPIDYIVLFYVLITTGLLIVFRERLQDELPHILFRFGVVALIFIMQWSYNRFPGSFTAFLRFAYPLAIVTFFYSETEYFNHLFFNNLDPVISGLDQKIFGFQPSLEFSQVVPYKWFNELMYMGYFAYYCITFLVAFNVFLFRTEVFQKVSFVIISAFIMYYIIFIIFPVVGPQFYFPYPENHVPAYGFFGNLVKLIQATAERPTAAFPSAHVGLGVILLYFSVVYLPRFAPVMIFFFVILCFATVYIKAHYLVDVLAGLVTGPLLGYLSSRLYSALALVIGPQNSHSI